MKFLHSFTLLFTVVGLVAIVHYWPAIKWYAKNKSTVDQAAAVADGLQQAGILQ